MQRPDRVTIAMLCGAGLLVSSVGGVGAAILMPVGATVAPVMHAVGGSLPILALREPYALPSLTERSLFEAPIQTPLGAAPLMPRLTGVTLGIRRLALIVLPEGSESARVVAIGDTIAGRRVVRIDADAVTLVLATDTLRLLLPEHLP